MKRKHVLAIVAFSIIGLVALAAYFLLFTTLGSTFFVESVISQYAQSGNIDVEESSGSLSRTLVFRDIEIKDSKILPPGSLLRIQRLEIYFASFNLEGLNVKIDNGRLQLSSSELILFYGTLHDNVLDANLYSKGMSLSEAVRLFAENKELEKISGFLHDIDVYIKGSLSEPRFSGQCQVTKLMRNGFSLSDCPVAFDLELKLSKNEPLFYGTLISDRGVISGPKTAVINMQSSKVLFSGVAKDAALSLKGSSLVEGAKINIELRGTLKNPELKLASDPALSQERLLVMLMTNKSWKGAEGALAKGELSPDLVSDFVDYFVFSGSGSRIAQQLGITGFSFTFDEQKKGVGVKKEITEKIGASYAIEQSQGIEEQSTTTQRIGTEVKITQGISIGAEKELKQEAKTDPAQQQPPNDKVILKIKKEF
ncbi:MAG: translocation/assembly module TamB domain-containing protein [Candidatus Omnitrophota bacterium]